MTHQTFRRLACTLLLAVTFASINGCVAWAGYCLATSSDLVCPKGDPEWGAGTDIPLYKSDFSHYFKQHGSTTWTTATDTVTAGGAPGHLTLQHKQPDFKLQMKFRVTGDARAALAVRAENAANITPSNAYLVTLADGADGSTVGSVAGLPKPTAAAAKGWSNQAVEVIASGPRLVVSVNGKKVTDAVVDRTADGFIAVTFHPGASGAGELQLIEIRRRSCHPKSPCL
jgi:hypothetical protein